MDELSSDLQDLVGRLISLHGEEGLSPTRADWAAILRCPADQPLHILNLLRFKPQVSTPEGPRTGSQAYASYSAGVGPAFARVGGRLLHFGQVRHSFGTVGGTDWHAAILTRYPTPRALAAFWLDPEFVAGHAHRASGVDQSRVLVMG